MRRYPSDYCARGRGTKKSGSVVYSGINRAVPFAMMTCAYGNYNGVDDIQHPPLKSVPDATRG